MIQLVLDADGENIVLPESQNTGYTVYKELLSESLEMVTGRMVLEERGTVWHISYQYGYFDEQTRNKLIAVCEKGRKTPITCGFLPQDSTDNNLTYSSFFIIDYSRPQFYWSKKQLSNGQYKDVPMWGNFSVELREVKPSD